MVASPQRGGSLISVCPISINRQRAADVFGVSPSKWDELVRTGWAPRPYRLDAGTPRWDYAMLAWWSRYCAEHGGTRWDDCRQAWVAERQRVR